MSARLKRQPGWNPGEVLWIPENWLAFRSGMIQRRTIHQLNQYCSALSE